MVLPWMFRIVLVAVAWDVICSSVLDLQSSYSRVLGVSGRDHLIECCVSHVVQ